MLMLRPSGVEPRRSEYIVPADSFLRVIEGAVRKLVRMVGKEFEVLVVRFT